MREYEAGRELDALVAERIMEWEKRGYEGVASPCWFRPGSTMPQNLKRYSTDISAAWDVVENHLSEAGLVDLITGGVVGGYEWQAQFMDSVGRVLGDACADTAPLAICRAALKAMEGPAA